jgi:hypothetical protein
MKKDIKKIQLEITWREAAEVRKRWKDLWLAI